LDYIAKWPRRSDEIEPRFDSTALAPIWTGLYVGADGGLSFASGATANGFVGGLHVGYKRARGRPAQIRCNGGCRYEGYETGSGNPVAKGHERASTLQSGRSAQAPLTRQPKPLFLDQLWPSRCGQAPPTGIPRGGSEAVRRKHPLACCWHLRASRLVTFDGLVRLGLLTERGHAADIRAPEDSWAHRNFHQHALFLAQVKGRFSAASRTWAESGVCAAVSYSAAIRSPLKHLAIRSPTPLSMLRQYSKVRASTGSVTPFLRWPTTLETKRSRSASFMTLRTRVPG